MSPMHADDRTDARSDFPSDAIAGALLRARVERGLTQERLAAAIVRAGADAGESLRLSGSAVSRWESGTFLPALRYRRFISQVLDLDVAGLIPPRRPTRRATHDRRK